MATTKLNRMMKKLTLTLTVILMACMGAFAQTIKASETKAKSFLDKGDLKNAKLYIETYLESEKFKKKPKTSVYITQAEIYMAIAMSEKAEDQKLLTDPTKSTLTIFDKVKEMSGGEGSDYEKVFDSQGIDFSTGMIKPSMKEQFRNYYFQKGADFYNESEDFGSAMKMFEKSYMVMPTDTLAMIYAFATARQEDDMDAVYRNGDKLISVNYTKPDPYLILSFDQYEKGRNFMDDAGDSKEAQAEAKKKAMPCYQKMMDYVTVGLKNVDDTLKSDLQQRQVTAYILLEKTDAAIAQLKKNSEMNPNDKSTLFTLGALYDEKDNDAEAIKYYGKALKVDPTYYDANLNHAVIYLDQAKVVFKEMDALLDNRGKFTDPEKAEVLGNKYDSILEKALPYLEAANKVKPDDMAVMQRMLQIYSTLDMNDKAKAITEKINSME